MAKNKNNAETQTQTAQTETNEVPTAQPEVQTPAVVEEAREYDLGAPFGIVSMTPSAYADFAKRFMGNEATKEVVKTDKEAKKLATEAVASVNQAERQAKVDATVTAAKAAGLEELPKGVKQAYVMHKSSNSEVGLNITLGGMSGYFGLYVPKGKGALAGDAWKSSPEHLARCEKAKLDVLKAFAILAEAMNAPVEVATAE